jgi:hypothetical protein
LKLKVVQEVMDIQVLVQMVMVEVVQVATVAQL